MCCERCRRHRRRTEENERQKKNEKRMVGLGNDFRIYIASNRERFSVHTALRLLSINSVRRRIYYSAMPWFRAANSEMIAPRDKVHRNGFSQHGWPWCSGAASLALALVVHTIS